MRKFNQLLRSWGDGLDPNHRPHMGFHIFQLRCFNCLSYIVCFLLWKSFVKCGLLPFKSAQVIFLVTFIQMEEGGGALPGILAWIGLLVLCIVED